MKDILFLVLVALVMYVVAKIFLKEPILPWKKKDEPLEADVHTANTNSKKKKKNDYNPLDEIESAPFKELFSNIRNLESHMIRHKDNTFTMIAEVTPVNYFLLDQQEQEGIDSIVETWFAQINYSVRIYLQNRFVDLTEPIEQMKRVMEEEDDLHHLAQEYGRNMINDLNHWQRSQPRFETMRYLVFDYKVNPSELRVDKDDDMDAKIITKAFTELRRRLNTAEGQLRKADINIHMLTTDGITEVLYYGFNRRKAVKNFYRDVEEKEQLALYVTADQSASQIVKVKGEIENAQESFEEKEEERIAN